MPVVHRLRALRSGTSPARALELFDELPPVTADDLLGTWAGRGIPTGHPLDGLLERYGWYGKRFGSSEDVDPLLFRAPRGRLVGLTPALLPVRPVLRMAPAARGPVGVAAFSLLRPLLTTGTPQARLRTVRYRGTVSAALVYDRFPAIDAFRGVDRDTVLGVMDLRWSPAPYVFVLRRAGGVTPR
ncbi:MULTISPECIES: DUF4334 domain-containing protein [unclassified Actinotalea]|uniref:DUF4334 domain-containing protein n=1 Tax=unclassified Actinotalea TaxID=2638618 RepID=UPI0015F40071|nr:MULTISPECIES: DUF4334 domain-containing protein [unclassified Actinotalea]